MSKLHLPDFSHTFRGIPPQPASIAWGYFWSSELQNALNIVKAGAANVRRFSEDAELSACWRNWLLMRMSLCSTLENIHRYSFCLNTVTGWVSHRDYVPSTEEIVTCYGIVLEVPQDMPVYPLREMIGMFFQDAPEMMPDLPLSAQHCFEIEPLYNKAMAAIQALNDSIELPATLCNLRYKYFI